jgi:type I restriction enzyme S subunit
MSDQDKLPFLPLGWTWVTFEESVESVSDEGRRVEASKYQTIGKLPVIDQGEAFIGGYTDDLSKAYEGDLPVIVFGDHTRRVKYVNFVFAVGAQGVKLLKPLQCWNSKLFFYLLSTAEIPSRGYSRHFQFLRNLKFPLPPLTEQQRIVDEIEKQFSRLDAAVKMLQRVKRSLERLRTATLKAAVEGRLVPTEAELARSEGRDYEPADVLLQRILRERRAKWEAEQVAKMNEQGKTPKDDKWKDKYPKPATPDVDSLNETPEGWGIANLEQITSSVRVIRYGILMPKENVTDGVLYVKVKDMKGDKIDLTSLHRTTPEIAAAYSGASLKAGDILLAIRGTYGRVAEVPPELEGGNITQDTARLAVSELINSRYIAFFLRSISSQNYFKRVARGVAVKGVNIADVRLTPIFIPPFAEQNRIVDEIERRISLLEELKTLVTKALRRASILRQKILRDAFTGKLISQGPIVESADELLERIKAERIQREAERQSARKGAKTSMRRKGKLPAGKRRDIVDVLKEANRWVKPEEVFSEAGYKPEDIEEFYADLKLADMADAFDEKKQRNGNVLLKARS